MLDVPDRSYYFVSGDSWPDEMLNSWRWLIGPTRFTIHRVTAMGSLFLLDAEGALFFLDTTEGTIDRVAGRADTFDTLFETSDNRKHYLWSFAIRELRQRGIQLKARQCYGWKIPTCLGGEADLENLEPIHVEAHVAIQGQIHEQVRKLPPGAKIDKVMIEDARTMKARLADN